MDNKMRELSIYVPQDLRAALEEAKTDAYSDRTQSEMLRDLITRGLAAQKLPA